MPLCYLNRFLQLCVKVCHGKSSGLRWVQGVRAAGLEVGFLDFYFFCSQPGALPRGGVLRRHSEVARLSQEPRWHTFYITDDHHHHRHHRHHHRHHPHRHRHYHNHHHPRDRTILYHRWPSYVQKLFRKIMERIYITYNIFRTVVTIVVSRKASRKDFPFSVEKTSRRPNRFLWPLSSLLAVFPPTLVIIIVIIIIIINDEM